MRLLRALLFAAAFNGATTVMTIAGVPVALAGRRRLARYVTQWGRLHGALSRTLLGIDLRVEGAMPPAPVLVAAKHESAYETLALLLLVDDPVIVLKRQLTRVPVLGRLMVLPYRPLAPSILRDIVRLQLDRVVRRVADNLGALLDYETLSGDEIKKLIAGEEIGRIDNGPRTPSVPSVGTSIPKTRRPNGPFGNPAPAGA